LQDHHAATEAHDAQECIYVTTGELTDKARSFAGKHAIRLVDGSDLARLLPGAGRGKKAA
jgi:restriction endonuclease Mrr